MKNKCCEVTKRSRQAGSAGEEATLGYILANTYRRAATSECCCARGISGCLRTWGKNYKNHQRTTARVGRYGVNLFCCLQPKSMPGRGIFASASPRIHHLPWFVSVPVMELITGGWRDAASSGNCWEISPVHLLPVTLR